MRRSWNPRLKGVGVASANHSIHYLRGIHSEKNKLRGLEIGRVPYDLSEQLLLYTQYTTILFSIVVCRTLVYLTLDLNLYLITLYTNLSEIGYTINDMPPACLCRLAVQGFRGIITVLKVSLAQWFCTQSSTKAIHVQKKLF